MAPHANFDLTALQDKGSWLPDSQHLPPKRLDFTHLVADNLTLPPIFLFHICFVLITVCAGSSDPFYIVSYYIKWVTTSWTHSSIFIGKQMFAALFD